MALEGPVTGNDTYWSHLDEDRAIASGLNEYMAFVLTHEQDESPDQVQLGPNGLDPIDEYEVEWFFDDF